MNVIPSWVTLAGIWYICKIKTLQSVLHFNQSCFSAQFSSSDYPVGILVVFSGERVSFLLFVHKLSELWSLHRGQVLLQHYLTKCTRFVQSSALGKYLLTCFFGFEMALDGSVLPWNFLTHSVNPWLACYGIALEIYFLAKYMQQNSVEMSLTLRLDCETALLTEIFDSMVSTVLLRVSSMLQNLVSREDIVTRGTSFNISQMLCRIDCTSSCTSWIDCLEFCSISARLLLKVFTSPCITVICFFSDSLSVSMFFNWCAMLLRTMSPLYFKNSTA